MIRLPVNLLPRPAKPWLAFLVAMLMAAAIEQIIEHFVHQAALVEERSTTLSRLAAVRARLEGLIYANFYRVRGLTAVIALHPNLDQETFERAARPLVDGKSLRNIGAAPDLVLRFIYPLEGNEAALGLDYRTHPRQREMALRARDRGEAVVAGPLPLVQGGSGVLVREPVFLDTPTGDRRFWGLISAVMDAETLYRLAGLRDSGLGLAIALRGTDGSGAQGPVFLGDPFLFEKKPVTLEVTLPGGTWQLAAIPTTGWGSRIGGRLAPIRILGLAAALAAGLLAWQRSQSGEIQRRLTGEIRRVNTHMTHLLDAAPAILYCLRLGPAGQAQAAWVSSNIARLLGYSTEEALAPGWWENHLHPQDRDRSKAALATLSQHGRFVHEYRFLDHNGNVRWIRDELRYLSETNEIIGAWVDITTEKEQEQLHAARMSVLEGLLASRPLERILAQITEHLETLRPDLRVSILQLREGRLFTASAPSLPAFYSQAVDGLEAAPGKTPCGSAAVSGEPVLAEDVEHHPDCVPYLEIIRRLGFRACWSIPYKDADGNVLGTFGVYHAAPRSPTPEELNLLIEFSQLAALAVEQSRAQTRIQQAKAVFFNASEGILITDTHARIVAVNPAFCQITGYSENEVLGRNPRLLQSGRQDRAFYREMWRCLTETGQWQGEVWNRRKNGEVYPQLLTISTVRDPEGCPVQYVALMNDLSHLRKIEERLDHLTHYDILTGLPNRLLLELSLTQALERCRRQSRQLAVLLLDLDDFSRFNDSLGHASGDVLLETLVRRLEQRLRKEDLLGRLGGDEFLVILEDMANPEAAARVAQHLQAALEAPFSVAGQEIYLHASIGISLAPSDGDNAEAVILHAEAALRQAKQQGRGGFRFYTATLSESARLRLTLESRMHQALGNGDFILHYQPQVELASGRITGCEALVRWQDPQQGLIPPHRFIPVAEESGFINSLGQWVLTAACRQARQWLDAGLPFGLVAVNLSARQLQGNLVDNVAAILEECGLPSTHLKLELTESMVMEQGEETLNLLRRLKGLGIQLALDDFGTGYSSLACLKRFPIDELKIDRSFVRDIPQDRNDMEIASTIIAMGKTLHFKVVAEGVETEAQRDFLLRQGCHAGQGYLYSKPVAAETFTRLISKPRQGERKRAVIRG